MKSIKAIIFDVDGVLFNSIDANNKYLWSANIKQDLGLRSQHFKMIFSPRWEDVTKGKLDTKRHLDEVFAHDLFRDLSLTADIFIDYWLSNDQFVNHEMVNFAKLLDVPIYIGTNQDTYRTAHIVKLVGNAFNGIFSSYQIGHLKPESGFYEYVEQTLNLQPAEILLIDDTLVNVQSAQQKGWHAHFYQGNIEQLKKFLKMFVD